MHQFDRELRRNIGWSNWEQNGVHKYAIEWNGLRYPVKQIIRMATGATDFGGGAEANSYVQARAAGGGSE
jgi:hypothetical protein